MQGLRDSVLENSYSEYDEKSVGDKRGYWDSILEEVFLNNDCFLEVYLEVDYSLTASGYANILSYDKYGVVIQNDDGVETYETRKQK